MFKFTVKPDGGKEYEVVGTARDVMQWEKEGSGRALAHLQQVRMTDLYALAHVASRRQGLFKGTLSEFESSVDIEFEQAASDPTKTAP